MKIDIIRCNGCQNVLTRNIRENSKMITMYKYNMERMGMSSLYTFVWKTRFQETNDGEGCQCEDCRYTEKIAHRSVQSATYKYFIYQLVLISSTKIYL